MSELERRISEARRATMTPQQIANLDRLAISNERFRVQIARLELGLKRGFRAIEKEERDRAVDALSRLAET